MLRIVLVTLYQLYIAISVHLGLSSYLVSGVMRFQCALLTGVLPCVQTVAN